MNRIHIAAAALITAAPAPALANPLSLDTEQMLGRSVFFDTSLSAQGNMACSSCHDPSTGFTSPRDDFNAAGAVVEGSVSGRFGNRKPPSAAYATFSPVLHHVVDGDDVTFVGGAFLDGRATGGKLGTPTADQAQGPFLNPAEMALPHAVCVVDRVLHPSDPSRYPVSYADVWGPASVFEIPAALTADCGDADAKITIEDEDLAARVDEAFDRIAISLAAFEASDEVNPFSSRYDAWAAGVGTLSEQEQRGFEIFTAEDKGNCAACHVLTPTGRSQHAIFTDWTFDNLGVPRNRDNPQGASYVDPGLGAYLETDPLYASFAADLMGAQQVPTLRNLDKRLSADASRAYMHNGYFKTLAGVVHFYNTRDVLPRCADPLASEAEALAANCWPEPQFEATMNTEELGDLKLTAADEADLVAFLKTLDDR
ncbi:MAG: c-type cytochrome [Defluviimonas sp.]|uniref:cytochrome-c peroxidase n=1 Tax=Albidovulum sp. TaxID=1872424 RepID=UPI001DC55BC8|nr:c-type cytochrome [Paracoccaceae bacterium]MCC0064883.1 c-type cytochrome [Defluviimonas sp.]